MCLVIRVRVLCTDVRVCSLLPPYSRGKSAHQDRRPRRFSPRNVSPKREGGQILRVERPFDLIMKRAAANLHIYRGCVLFSVFRNRAFYVNNNDICICERVKHDFSHTEAIFSSPKCNLSVYVPVFFECFFFKCSITPYLYNQ